MAYTQQQLDQIAQVQQERSLTRKSAVQFCTRLWKKEAAKAQPSEVKERPQARTMARPAAPQANPLPPSMMVTTPPPAKPVQRPAPVKTAPAVKEEKAVAPEAPAHHEIEITLKPVPEVKGAYFAVVHGRRAVVCFVERDRSAAALRYNSLTYGRGRIDAAQKAAKAAGLPLYYGAQVRVGGRWDSGWLVAATTAQVFIVVSEDYRLSAPARIAYAACKDSYAGGVKFVVEEAQA